MFRNHYDSDVTVLSPQGRIHQIEYAMEAVKQGSSTVGLKNKTHGVLVALMKHLRIGISSEKIFILDDNLGLSIAGLTADGKILSKYMLNESLYYRYEHDNPMPLERLVRRVCNKMQVNTQRYGRRPYGVGLLVCGYDNIGPHIFQICPSANYYDCKSMAIGSRSQAARTYLEKHMQDIRDGDLEDLVKHGIKALKETLPSEVELSDKNCQIAIVGKGTPFAVYDKDTVLKYIGIAIKEIQAAKAAAVAAIEAQAESAQPIPGEEGQRPPPPDVSMDEGDPATNTTS